MNFAFDAEQDMLRDRAVRLLRDRVVLGRLTAQGNRPDARYDLGLWRDMVGLGWPGLIVPEQYGGLGLSLVDWVVITEELGRALAPCPYFGNYVGTVALLSAGGDDHKRALLPLVVTGEAQLAFACNESANREDAGSVNSRVLNGRLTGAKRFVSDADTATHFIVSARAEDGCLGLYVVERDGAGVHVDPLEWMDITRRVADLRFDGAPAEWLGIGFDTAWPKIHGAALLALASECAGGADAILRRTVAYANERVQFGKPIASFQAIKHKCADMLMKVESAKALSYYAACALSQQDDERASEGELAAAMAKSFACDAYRFCAAEAIQIHGAVGFTWEMPVHLYYKRARANSAMFGSSAVLRDRVIALAVARAA